MSSLVDFLRQADPSYNNKSSRDIIRDTGDAAKKDPATWDALKAEFPDFEGHYDQVRDTQSDFTDTRNSFLRGAANDGVLMPAEGIARMVSADGVADWIKEQREAVDKALPVDDNFSEGTFGQVVRGVGQVVPMFAMNSVLPGSAIEGAIAKRAATLAGRGMTRDAAEELAKQQIVGGLSKQGASKLAIASGRFVTPQAAYMAANAAGQGYQTGVDDARNNGATDADTLRTAGLGNLPGALLEFASDRLLVDRVLGPILKKKVLTPGQLVASVATNSVAEGLTEGAQQALTNYVASSVAGYDPERPLGEDVVQGILIGGLVGGVVSGTGTVISNEVSRRSNSVIQPKAEEESKPTIAIRTAQAVLSRKEAELVKLQSMRPADLPASPEEQAIAAEIAALQAAIARDATKLNGLSPSSVKSITAQVKSEMESIAGDGNNPDAIQAAAELRRGTVTNALNDIEEKLGPAEELVKNGGSVVARRLRDRTPEEQALLTEAGQLEEAIQQAASAPPAPAPKKDAADKAIARAEQKVAVAEEVDTARQGDAIINRESGGALSGDIDPAEAAMNRIVNEQPAPATDAATLPAPIASEAETPLASVPATPEAQQPAPSPAAEELVQPPPVANAAPTEPFSDSDPSMSGRRASRIADINALRAEAIDTANRTIAASEAAGTPAPIYLTSLRDNLIAQEPLVGPESSLEASTGDQAIAASAPVAPTAAVEQPAAVEPAKPVAPPPISISEHLDIITQIAPPLAMMEKPISVAKTKISGTAESTDSLRGRTIIAIQHPDSGVVFIRNYYEDKDGGRAENMGARGSKKAVSIQRLVNDGWTVLGHPMLLSEPAVVNAYLSPEEFQEWMQRNRDVIARVQETQREGTPAALFNELLNQTNPDFVNTVNYLVGHLASESMAEPSSIYAGLIKPFSESDDVETNRAQRTQMEALSRSRTNPTSILRESGGKIVGIFDAHQFSEYSRFVNENNAPAADALLARLTDRGDVKGESVRTSAESLKAWAIDVANRGRESIAYWGKGESKGRIVSLDQKTSSGETRADKMAGKIAEGGPENTDADTKVDLIINDRADLIRLGVSEASIDYILSELEGNPNPTYTDVSDVLEYNRSDLPGFWNPAKAFENPDAFTDRAIEALRGIAIGISEGVGGVAAGQSEERSARKGPEAARSSDGRDQRGADAEESGTSGRGSEARSEDVAVIAPVAESEAGADALRGAGQSGSEPASPAAEAVIPKSPEKAAKVSGLQSVPESAELDAIFGAIGEDLADDTKFSEPRAPVLTLPSYPNGWLSQDGRSFVEADQFGQRHYDQSSSGHDVSALNWMMENKPGLIPQGKTNRELGPIARREMFRLGFSRIASDSSAIFIEGTLSRAQLDQAIMLGIQDETKVVHDRGPRGGKTLYDPSDAKRSEPTGDAVRVGGQEKASVLDKLVQALAMLVEKGVRTFSVAMQYISKRVGSDLALSTAGHLQSKWNEWRVKNPQWGLDQAGDGVKALTGIKAIRPPAQDLGEGKYPKVPDMVGKRYGDTLAPEQKLAVNMMVYAAATKQKGFLLGDGTGMGKTRALLATADFISKHSGGKPVLILTENRMILDGNFTVDARSMGLVSANGKLGEMAGIKFGTYHNLSRGEFDGENYAAIFLDEAHKLRNPNGSAHIAEGKLKREFTVYSTATPLDEIYQSLYFLSGITGQTHEDLAAKIGVRVTWEKDPFTGVESPQIENVPGVTEEQATINLKALRDEAMTKGLIVRRVFPFFGKMELMPVQITEAQRKEEESIMASHGDAIAEATSFGGGSRGVRVPGKLSQKAKLSGQRTLDIARWTETQKATAVFEDMKREIAAGKHVVVMSDSSGPRMIQGLGGIQIDGLLDSLAAMCQAEGISYVDIRGDGNKSKAVDAFQGNGPKVALATLRSGGTGINLDDTNGGFPRVAYIVSLPWSALEFDQVIGRFSRRNTASPATVKFVFLAEQNAETKAWSPASMSESRRVSNLSRKLTLMRMMQGQRVDFDDIFGPMGNAQENERRLLDRTFTAPELGEDVKYSKPTGYTLPFIEDDGYDRNEIIDQRDALMRELASIGDEDPSVSMPESEMLLDPDYRSHMPNPGTFRVNKEIGVNDNVIRRVVRYNLDNRFIVTVEKVDGPKRSDHASAASFKAAKAEHAKTMANLMGELSYLPAEKIPGPTESFGRVEFYDINKPNNYSSTTGALGEAPVAASRELIEAVNLVTDQARDEFGLSKFWLGEGNNSGSVLPDGTRLPGDRAPDGTRLEDSQRTRVYKKLRLRGTIKASEPITAKDLPLIDRSYLVPPKPFNFERYQATKAALTEAGMNVREIQAFVEHASGAISSKKSTIWLTAESFTNPTDELIGVLGHEVVHHVFAGVSPAEKVRILRAVAKLRSIQGSRFDLDESSNLSLQLKDPAAKWEEFLAEGLKDEGISPLKAASYAKQIVDHIRAVITATAKFLLERVNKFGWTDAQLDRIALDMFESRVREFASGGTVKAKTLADVTGGVAPTLEWRSQATGHPRAQFDPTSALPAADEGSLAFNLQRLLVDLNANNEAKSEPDSDIRYSRPIGDAENPEDRVHQNLAPINHQLEVERRVVNVLGPKFAAEAQARQQSPATALRNLLGLPDLDHMKAQAVNLRDPRTGNTIPKVVADFTPAMFRNEGLSAQAKIDAYDALGQQRKTVSDQLHADLGRLSLLKNRRSRFVRDFDEARRDYMNAGGLTSVLRRGIHQMISDERQKIGLAFQRRGMVMQQLQQLDARPIADVERAFSRVIDRVLKDSVGGRKFFDILDGLRASGVDYKTLNASEIRQALIDKGILPEVTAQSDESKVLLSATVAFSKTHDSIMEKLELRRMKSVAERTKLEAELTKLAQTKQVNTKNAINALPATAKFEERIKQTYLAAKRDLKTMDDEIAFIQSRAATATVALPIYGNAIGELGGDLGVRAQFTFGQGAVVNNPLTDSASPKEISDSKFTIELDTNRAITNRAALLNVAANQTRWLAWRESTGTIDPLYLSIKAQRDGILHSIAATEVKPAYQHLKATLMIHPVADRMAAVGTPLARSIGAMVNQFAGVNASLIQQSHRLARRSEIARDATMKLLPKGVSLSTYKDFFLNPAKSIIEKEKSILEDLSLSPDQAKTRIWSKVKAQLIDNPTSRGLMGVNTDAIMSSLRVNVDADYEAGKLYYDFTHTKNNLGVIDNKVRVLNPATGEYEDGIRDGFTQGTQTFSRGLSSLARQTYKRMVMLGWGGFHSDGMADLYTKSGASAVNSVMDNLLNDPLVQRGMIRPMIENDSLAMFDAPLLADGVTRPEADPSKVRIAWEMAGGNFVKFAENLFDLHNGTGGAAAKAKFVESSIGTLAEKFGALHETMKDIDPAGAGIAINQIKGMVHGFQIESRVWERMPTAWSDYHTFDRINVNEFNHRVAAQVAFGRDQSRLHNAFESLAIEAGHASDVLINTQAEVKSEAMDKGRVITSKKEVEKAMIAKLGDAEYRRLRAITDNASVIESSRRGLIGFFNQDTQGAMGVVRGPLQTAQAMAWGMLQQPTSALMNMTDVFSPIMQSGLSPMTIKQSLRMMKAGSSDVVGALAESFGMQLFRKGHLEEAFHDLGLNDADAERKFMQLTKEYDPIDPTKQTAIVPRVLRKWIELQSFNVNRADSRHTALRPLAPFTTTAIVMNRAATLSMWASAEDLVLRGLKHFKADPASNGDAGYKLTAGDLGLTGLNADSFRKLEAQFADHGIDLTRMTREAQSRMGGPANKRALLSDNDRQMLHGVAGAETQLESSLATMAPGAFTNPAIRIALPLLGWSLRRAMQVPGLFTHSNGRFIVDEQNRVRLNAVALGALAVAAAAVPALFYSLLVDKFQKDVLGKQRNIPSVDAIFDSEMNVSHRALVAMENLNRVGTFGMFGDVLNTVVSSGAGQGDNRSMSIDGRVVAVAAAYSLMHAANTFINQGGSADYSGVVRPLISSMGGGGFLQWTQIANNALDLDNSESRFIRRVNVMNEMKVYGRINAMEMKPRAFSSSGGSAANSTTPHVVEMQLSAYADDYEGFVVSWKKAVAAELASGRASTVREAEANAKRSFQSRHPLRSAFRSIGETQYRTMLANVDEKSSDDIRGAVDSFNRYAKTLGIGAYRGGQDKPVRAPMEMSEADIRESLMGL